MLLQSIGNFGLRLPYLSYFYGIPGAQVLHAIYVPLAVAQAIGRSERHMQDVLAMHLCIVSFVRLLVTFYVADLLIGDKFGGEEKCRSLSLLELLYGESYLNRDYKHIRPLVNSTNEEERHQLGITYAATNIRIEMTFEGYKAKGAHLLAEVTNSTQGLESDARDVTIPRLVRYLV